MKKLLLSLIALIGILVSPSFALTGSGSSNKTLLQTALVGYSNGTAGYPQAFITGTNNTQAIQACVGQGAVVSATGTASGVLLGCGNTPITGINISGGASGGTIAIYDANTNQINQAFPAEVGTAEAVFEATVASNTQNYYDLHDAPINTQNGVVAIASGTSGTVVYSSSSVASNH